MKKIEYIDRFIPPKGFRFAGVQSGIKSKGKDLALIFADVPCKSAAVYTTNAFAAAPVEVSKDHQHAMMPQAIIINSGNANAATGKQGLKDAYKMAEITGKDLGIDPKSVLVASTGAIGRTLPMKKVEMGILKAVKELSHNAGNEAAQAIITTDNKIKTATVQFTVDNQLITMAGMAKGSGMINPDMKPQATMLAFIVTDLKTRRKYIKKMLSQAAEKTFNAITVEGDVSTNDMAVIMADGSQNNKKVDEKSPDSAVFEQALEMLCMALARKIIEDGEGATKFITVQVAKAKTPADAKQCAKAVANSVLVKTALYGNQPNIGRVLAAVGSSGSEVEPDKVKVTYNGLEVVKSGALVKADSRKLNAAVKKREILIKIDLGTGKEEFSVLTTDLSKEYVALNAEYLT